MGELPQRIGLCPVHQEEFFYPLQDDEGLQCPVCELEMTLYVRSPVQVTEEMVDRALGAWRYGPMGESPLSGNLLTVGIHGGELEATISNSDGSQTWGEALPEDVTRAAVRRLLEAALNPVSRAGGGTEGP